MAEAVTLVQEKALSFRLGRWWQLTLGVICMSMIANLQYGWTLFVNPIHDKHGWSLSAIQVAFSIFVLVETWLVPIEGYIVDRIGPKLVCVLAGILVAAAWVIQSYANTLPMLYLGAVAAGLGGGTVYGACVGNALKWFPDRRGLAAGITAMGFGAGSALTVFPIANMIKSQGYEAAFFKFGIAQGAVVFLVSWLLKAPEGTSSHGTKRDSVAAPASFVSRRAHEYTPVEMMRTSAFWLMLVMFALTATGGLIFTAQLTPIAKDLHIADAPVSLFGVTLIALPLALSASRIFNGVSRPFFGWVSDKIGREETMCIAFLLEAATILVLAQMGAGHHPLLFVGLTCLLFFAYGEIYSLFPAICADAYGRQFAAANAGLLYTGKGLAAMIVPISSVIAVTSFGWHGVFVAAAILNVIAALMAPLLLKPARARMARA